MNVQNQWWGYKHSNGSLQVKRYFSPQDIFEARSSSFVVTTYGPFPAASREEALKHIRGFERGDS